VNSPGSDVRVPRLSLSTLIAGRRRWIAAGLDLLFPPQCAHCAAPLEVSQASLICAACRAELADPREFCPRCGLSAVHDVSGCAHCRGERLHYSGVVRLGTYTGKLRSAVLRIKHPSERGLALALGGLLADTQLSRFEASMPEGVVPIPLHWTRRLRRGGNGPEAIAERLAQALDVPLATHLLIRQRRTAPQASLPPAKRRTNMRGAFRAGRDADLAGARLLLVDDVMTTGSTVNEAAKVLVRAGAAQITVAVLARADGVD